MAKMSTSQRKALWAEFMREVSRERERLALTKPQLRAAIDAADDWLDDNAASFNAALPVAARTALDARQKARLLRAILGKRFEVI